MASYLPVRAAFLFLLIPAAVSAAALDDYYLSKFGEDRTAARALREIVPGEVVQAERCLTPLHRNVKRDWTRLEPTTQRVLAKYVAKPVLSGKATFLSPGGHFAVHYATTPAPTVSGSDAPDLTDDDFDGVPDWVEKVAAAFEHVYDVEVTGMAYRPPPGTRYDVYLRNLRDIDTPAYGFTSNDGFPALPNTSVASYIEIDRAFTDPLFTVNGRYTPREILDITAAHEFHHAIQYGYNYYFDIWYAEVTSTWMEDEVYDSVNQLYDYLPKYLPLAYKLPLDGPLDGNSEYGRWIFNRYLAERHSPALIRDAWTRLGATAAPADGSDIPMIPVLDAALRAGGSSAPEALAGFAKKLYLRDWSTHVVDNARIPLVAPQAIYASYPVDASEITALVAALPRYAFVSFKFLPSASAPAELTLTLPNVPAGVDIVAVRKGSNGSVDQYAFNRTTGTVTVPSFNAAATSEVQLIVSNSTSNPAPIAMAPGVSGSGGGGGCFIATAAYGSYLHPKVAELRAFRDNRLLTNAPGRLLVSLYYRLSPPVARVVGEHEWMRAGVRVGLAPVILAVEHQGVALAILLLSAGGAVWRLSRRRGSVGLA